MFIKLKLATKIPAIMTGLVIAAVTLIVAVQSYSTKSMIEEEAISCFAFRNYVT